MLATSAATEAVRTIPRDGLDVMQGRTAAPMEIGELAEEAGLQPVKAESTQKQLADFKEQVVKEVSAMFQGKGAQGGASGTFFEPFTAI